MITEVPPTLSPPPAETRRMIRPKWCSLLVWQIFILIAGIATILVGIVLLPAPGPGSLVIYAGIGILATEFVWAKRWFILIGHLAKQLLMRIRVWIKQIWRNEKS